MGMFGPKTTHVRTIQEKGSHRRAEEAGGTRLEEEAISCPGRIKAADLKTAEAAELWKKIEALQKQADIPWSFYSNEYPLLLAGPFPGVDVAG